MSVYTIKQLKAAANDINEQILDDDGTITSTKKGDLERDLLEVIGELVSEDSETLEAITVTLLEDLAIAAGIEVPWESVEDDADDADDADDEDDADEDDGDFEEEEIARPKAKKVAGSPDPIPEAQAKKVEVAEEEEAKPKAKAKAKKAEPVAEVAEEEVAEEEVKPKAKKVAAATKYTRIDAFCEVMKMGKTLTKREIMIETDGLYSKKTGHPIGMNQSGNISNQLLPLTELGFVLKGKNKNGEITYRLA